MSLNTKAQRDGGTNIKQHGERQNTVRTGGNVSTCSQTAKRARSEHGGRWGGVKKQTGQTRHRTEHGRKELRLRKNREAGKATDGQIRGIRGKVKPGVVWGKVSLKHRVFRGERNKRTRK